MPIISERDWARKVLPEYRLEDGEEVSIGIGWTCIF